MDIRAIKLYLDLCDTLHFSRTATRMHVSPSTLSRTLQSWKMKWAASCWSGTTAALP